MTANSVQSSVITELTFGFQFRVNMKFKGWIGSQQEVLTLDAFAIYFYDVIDNLHSSNQV